MTRELELSLPPTLIPGRGEKLETIHLPMLSDLTNYAQVLKSP